MSMSQRNSISQTKHDRRVSMEAKSYRRRGYSVQVDIPGYPRPRAIDVFIPDIITRKGTYISIVEVETADTVNSSHAQRQNSAFRQAANQRSNWHYRRMVTA